MEVVETLPFTYVHVFPYSERRDTDAAGMREKVPSRVKKARSREIRGRVREKAAAHRRARVGTVARIVLEGDELQTAVTGDYLKMPADDRLKEAGRRLQRARIESIGRGRLKAAATISKETAATG
jgi:threonylcarbamoyladenosine tRNA methylthiotransferase MtaB